MASSMQIFSPANPKNNLARGKKRARCDEDDRNNKNSSVTYHDLQTEEEDHQQPQQQPKWSKSKKKRMRAKQIKEKNNHCTFESDKNCPKSENVKCKPSLAKAEKRNHLELQQSNTINTSSSASALQKSFQERLSGSRFRILNEELYTSTSAVAYKRFQENPSLFDEYHAGFRHQVGQWPINPISIIVEELKRIFESSASSAPKKKKKVVVADFGCGEAELAKQLLNIRDSKAFCPFAVHSFDLVAKGPNAELITACDAAHTPLTAGTVDYGIFCLSLMGTNLADFIREGHRVLKPDGKLLIAEVRSRIETVTSIKKDNDLNAIVKENDSTLRQFIDAIDQLGFEVTHSDRSNKMFVLLTLKKNGKKPRKGYMFTLKPCLYKRR